MQRGLTGAHKKLTEARSQTFHHNLKITWQSAAATQKQNEKQLQLENKHNENTKKQCSKVETKQNERLKRAKKQQKQQWSMKIKMEVMQSDGGFKARTKSINSYVCIHVFVVLTKISTNNNNNDNHLILGQRSQ